MHACSVMYCVDCNLPGSSVHGLSQAETWEWVATPSSALGRSGWSQDLGCSGSSGEGWVGLEVWLCPLAAPSWDPSPRHQGGLDGSCPGDRGWGRAKGQGSPGKGNGWGGHACGTRLTLQIKNHLPVCCPLSESGRNSRVGCKALQRGGERRREQGGSRALRASGWARRVLPLQDSSPQHPQPSTSAPRCPPGGPPAEAWSLTS